MTNDQARHEAQAFSDAIALANIPSLLMMLVQLSGDLHWLEEPYRPTRARGATDHDDGGLAPAEQTIVRRAARWSAPRGPGRRRHDRLRRAPGSDDRAPPTNADRRSVAPAS